MIDSYKPILDDQWDPDTNPGGFVNIGTAENVSYYSFHFLSICMRDSHGTR